MPEHVQCFVSYWKGGRQNNVLIGPMTRRQRQRRQFPHRHSLPRRKAGIQGILLVGSLRRTLAKSFDTSLRRTCCYEVCHATDTCMCIPIPPQVKNVSRIVSQLLNRDPLTFLYCDPVDVLLRAWCYLLSQKRFRRVACSLHTWPEVRRMSNLSIPFLRLMVLRTGTYCSFQFILQSISNFSSQCTLSLF